MLERLGAVVTDLGILADDPDKVADALREAASGHDLDHYLGRRFQPGEADYVRAAVERVGNLAFWRVAIKPGRPVALGVIRGNVRTWRRLCGPAGQPGRRCS